MQTIEPDSHLQWKQALMPLAVHRCIPLWADAGVPAELSNTPEPLIALTQSYLEHSSPQMNSPPAGEGWIPMLKHMFGQLAREYGASVSTALYSWSERYFVDNERSILWHRWGNVLAAMEDYIDQGLLSAKDEPALIQRFIAAVGVYFDPVAEQRSDELTTRAYSVPLSPLEKRLVAMEVVHPSDMAEFDPVLLLSITFDPHRAYCVWKEIDGSRLPAERGAVIEWVRAATRRLRMGPDGEHLEAPILS